MMASFVLLFVILLWRLLICGDIELNPGPARWPCVLCSEPVTSNQDGIECSSCRIWCHRKCDGLSLNEYHRLSHCEDEWFCRRCTLPPFSTSYFDTSVGVSSSSPSDLSSVTSSVTDDGMSTTLLTPPGVQRSVSCLFFNARSIVNKRLDFLPLISTNKFDILAVCESFLDSTILDSEVVPSQYTVYRSDRNRHGGRLLLAITNSIVSVRRSDLERPDIELLWTQLFCGSCSILFGVTYRPPSSVDFVSSLATSLHMISPS